MSTLGDMVVNLTLDQRQFSAGITASTSTLDTFVDETSQRLSKLKTTLQDQFSLNSIADSNERAVTRLGQQYRDVVEKINSSFTGTNREELLGQAAQSFEAQLARMREATVRETNAINSKLGTLKRSLTQQFDLDIVADSNERAMLRLRQQHQATIHQIKSSFEGLTRDALLERATQSFEAQMLRMRNAASGVSDQVEKIGKSSTKLNGILTQSSYALDDFLSVYSMTGQYAPALRGTANNLGLIAMQLHPLAGMATTVALTLGTVLIPKLFETGDAAEDAASGIDRIAQAADEFEAKMDRIYQMADTERRIASIFDANQIANEQRRVRTSIQQITREIEYFRSLQDGLGEGQVVNPYTGESAPILNDEQRQQFNDLQKRIDEKTHSLTSLHRQLGSLSENAATTAKKAAEDSKKAWRGVGDSIVQGFSTAWDKAIQESQRLQDLQKNFENAFRLDQINDPLQRQLESARQQMEQTIASIKSAGFSEAVTSSLIDQAEQAFNSKTARLIEDGQKKSPKEKADRRSLDDSRSGNQALETQSREGVAAAIRAITGGNVSEQQKQTQQLAKIADKQDSATEHLRKIAQSLRDDTQLIKIGEIS